VRAAASQKRASGVLLHITSLPSAFGIGDLGPKSYCFADLLASHKQRYWSILPLSPTRLEYGNSPYLISSAFAGNHLLISPEKLAEDGFIPRPSTERMPDSDRVNFEAVYPLKASILKVAYASFKKTGLQKEEFEAFCYRQQKWLNNYALYTVLHQKTGLPWNLWFPSLRTRDPKAIARKRQKYKAEIEAQKFTQFLFFRQWSNLKSYCQSKHIKVIGDIPFYMAHDSADVWEHPELFSLYKNGKPRYVGGVPPDYFSATGQLWGNPVYNWQKHAQTGFEWWLDRMQHNLGLCDKLRLDHFRGFVAYWRVPATAKTAVKGRWIRAPSEDFFAKLRAAFPRLPFIAEDLGYIDEPVKEAICRLGIPGMRVLLFGFGGSKDNPHILKNHVKNSVVYTGTHDTNTARGWFTTEATAIEKQVLLRFVGKKVIETGVSAEVVRLAQSSIADLCIVPFQDVLGLGAKARMNNPSKSTGNWQWKATERQFSDNTLAQLADLTVQNCRD
jgi:4-alpha-glucanotransferase